MNYNNAFAPTAAAERFFNRAHTFDIRLEQRLHAIAAPHIQNLPTYALIVAVIALTSALNLIDWLNSQTHRVPEHRIRLQLAKVRIKRWFVRRAIAFASFASYHGLDSRILKVREL